MFSKRHLFRRNLLFKNFGAVFPMSENTLILYTYILLRKHSKFTLKVSYAAHLYRPRAGRRMLIAGSFHCAPASPASSTGPNQPHRVSFWLKLSQDCKLSLSVCSAVCTSVEKKQEAVPLPWAETDCSEPTGHQHNIQCVSAEHQPTAPKACWTFHVTPLLRTAFLIV